MVAQAFVPSKVDANKTEPEDTWFTEPGKPRSQGKSLSQMEKRKDRAGIRIHHTYRILTKSWHILLPELSTDTDAGIIKGSELTLY